jgi:hypothetical protein
MVFEKFIRPRTDKYSSGRGRWCCRAFVEGTELYPRWRRSKYRRLTVALLFVADPLTLVHIAVGAFVSAVSVFFADNEIALVPVPVGPVCLP